MNLFQILRICDESGHKTLEIITVVLLLGSFILLAKGVWDILNSFIHNKKNKKVKQGIIFICISIIIIIFIILNHDKLLGC